MGVLHCNTPAIKGPAAMPYRMMHCAGGGGVPFSNFSDPQQLGRGCCHNGEAGLSGDNTGVWGGPVLLVVVITECLGCPCLECITLLD